MLRAPNKTQEIDEVKSNQHVKVEKRKRKLNDYKINSIQRLSSYKRCGAVNAASAVFREENKKQKESAQETKGVKNYI